MKYSHYIKTIIIIVCCANSLAISAQTKGVVIDMDSNAPVTNAMIYTNTNKVVMASKSGRYTIDVPFSSVTFSAIGYLKRTLTKSELRGDTIFMMPSSISLHEVVVMGKRPGITMPIKKFVKQATSNIFNTHPGISFDFFSIFQRNKVSAKERKERQDAIANY